MPIDCHHRRVACLLPFGYERGVGLRWNDPLLLEPRPEFVFSASATPWMSRWTRRLPAQPVCRPTVSWSSAPGLRVDGSRPGQSSVPPECRRVRDTGSWRPSSCAGWRPAPWRRTGRGRARGLAVDSQSLGDAVIGPVIRAVSVDAEQNGGASAGVGGAGACADQPLKRSPLVGGQPNFDLARWCSQDIPPVGTGRT